MTPSELAKKEADEITGRLGYYIPPYRISELMKIAHKITEILTRSTFCMTYRECKIILDTVDDMLAKVTEEEDK